MKSARHIIKLLGKTNGKDALRKISQIVIRESETIWNERYPITLSEEEQCSIVEEQEAEELSQRDIEDLNSSEHFSQIIDPVIDNDEEIFNSQLLTTQQEELISNLFQGQNY